MRLAACDVTSSNILGRWVLREQIGWDRERLGGTVEGMAMSGLGLRKALVCTGYSPPTHDWA